MCLFIVMLLFLQFCSGGFIVNFKQFSCFNLVLLLSALNMIARMQQYIQNSVEHLRWSLLRKQLRSILDVCLFSGYISRVNVNKIKKGFHGSKVLLFYNLSYYSYFPLVQYQKNLLAVSFETSLRRRGDVTMVRRCYVLLRRCDDAH